jgi:hypothetical protein
MAHPQPPPAAIDPQLMQEIKNLFAENAQRSKNEQALYNAWVQSEKDKKNLEQIIITLQTEVAALKQQITTPEHHDQNNITHVMDADDLAPETEWVRVEQGKRKRRHIEPPQPVNLTNKPLSPPNNQRTGPEPPDLNHPQHQHTHRPPPIVMENVSSYPQTITALTAANIPLDGYQVKLLNNNRIKISSATPNIYRAITSLLNIKGIQWHSYEDKQNRDIRVMIKNLHHSIDPTDIVNQLNQQGLKATSAVNKQKWLTVEQKLERRTNGLPEVVPLDMFIVSFDKDTNIDNIYNIKSIYNSKVQIEPLRKSKIIPQCKRCQAYGHTQNYCHKAPRCVKCGKPHLTQDCNKPATEEPKCTHCGKNHPANYRGCEVYKDLFKLRYNSTNRQAQFDRSLRQSNTSTAPRLTQSFPPTEKPTTNNVPSTPPPEPRSYSQAVIGKQKTPTDTMLLLILQRLDKLEASLAYA